MRDEAKRILNTLPGEVWNTREAWAGYVLEGEEWKKNQQTSIIRFATLLCHFINQYSSEASLDIAKKYTG